MKIMTGATVAAGFVGAVFARNPNEFEERARRALADFGRFASGTTARGPTRGYTLISGVQQFCVTYRSGLTESGARWT